jgi:hypothetical protein
MFNKSTRSYFFHALMVEAMRKGDITWREARLMFKGATVAAIVYAKRNH